MRLCSHPASARSCIRRALSGSALAALVLLTGCGGGSSSGTTTPVITATTRFVRKADLSTHGAQPGQILNPGNLAADAGHVYVVDHDGSSNGNFYGSRIQVFRSDGTFVSQFIPTYGEPSSVASDGQGNLYVAEVPAAQPASGGVTAGPIPGRIGVYHADGTLVREIGVNDSHVGYPTSVAVDAQGTVYVADAAAGQVEVFGSDGTYKRNIGAPTPSGRFLYLIAVALDGRGNAYVVDVGAPGTVPPIAGSVLMFKNDGTYVRSIGGASAGGPGLLAPAALSVDKQGNVYVLNYTTTNSQVQVYNSGGAYVTQFFNEASAHPFGFTTPGLALNSAGNVYVADNASTQVAVFAPSN